jgi:hypothetical protein
MVVFDSGKNIGCCSNHLCVERATSSIPPDVPSQQAVERPVNAPPRSLAMVEQEESNLIEDIENSHEDEEHISPPKLKMVMRVTLVMTQRRGEAGAGATER